MKHFILIFFLSCCHYLAAQNIFKGHVTDAATCEDMPFVGVRIASLNLETQTDIDGNFIFEKLPPGSYSVKLTFIGYQVTEAIINVKVVKQSVQQFYMNVNTGVYLDANDPLEYQRPLIDPANDSIHANH